MRSTASQSGSTVGIEEVSRGEDKNEPFDFEKMSQEAEKITTEFRSFYQAKVSQAGECRDEEEEENNTKSTGSLLGRLKIGFTNAAKATSFARAVASRDFLFSLLASKSPSCHLFDSQNSNAMASNNPAVSQKTPAVGGGDSCKAGIENPKSPTELDKLKTLAFYNTIESVSDLGEPSFAERLFSQAKTPDPFKRDFKGSKAMLAYKRVEQFLFKEKIQGEVFGKFLLNCEQTNGPLNLFISLENDLRDAAAQCGSKDAFNTLSLLNSFGQNTNEDQLFAGYYGLGKFNSNSKTKLFKNMPGSEKILSMCPADESITEQSNGFVSKNASETTPLGGRKIEGLSALGLEAPGKKGDKNSNDCKKILARYEFALGFILNNQKALDAWQGKQLQFETEKAKSQH